MELVHPNQLQPFIVYPGQEQEMANNLRNQQTNFNQDTQQLPYRGHQYSNGVGNVRTQPPQKIYVKKQPRPKLSQPAFEDLFIWTVVFLIAIDYVWVGFLFADHYRALFSEIQNHEVRIKYGPALMVYLFLALLIVVFVMPMMDRAQERQVMKNGNNETGKLSRDQILKYSAKYGGLLGLAVYGIYNFTNQALFDDYDLVASLIDMLWGGFLTFIVTAIVYAVTHRDVDSKEAFVTSNLMI